MNIRSSVSAITILMFAVLFGLTTGCSHNEKRVSTQESSVVTDGVKKLVFNTAVDIGAKGPIAWLSYFEKSPDFYMASDGAIAFKSYDAADRFIKSTLVKQLKSINLKWSVLRIDVISEHYATIGTTFHEDLVDFSGKTMPIDGYFTATAHQTADGWKYKNMHWSIKK